MAGFPVAVQNASMRSVFEIIQTEGIPGSVATSYSGNIGTGGINLAIGNLSLMAANRAFYCTSLIVKANCYADVQVIGSGGALGTAIPTIKLTTSPTANAIVPMGKIYRPAYGTTTTSTAMIGSAAIRKLLNADGTDATVANTAAYVQVTMDGFYIYDDLNFGADKVIQFWGDSIFNSVGRTNKLACWDWKIRNYYAAKQPVRGVMKASSGSTSSDHELWRQYGWHDEQQCDLFVYELLINDAAQGISASTFGANLLAAINHKKVMWPRAKMLVIATHPVQSSSIETPAAVLRAKAAEVVATAQDDSIFICDLGALGSAFSTVNANYATSDGAGAGLHPSDAGDAIIWSGNAGFLGIRAFLDANLPKI